MYKLFLHTGASRGKRPLWSEAQHLQDPTNEHIFSWSTFLWPCCSQTGHHLPGGFASCQSTQVQHFLFFHTNLLQLVRKTPVCLMPGGSEQSVYQAVRWIKCLLLLPEIRLTRVLRLARKMKSIRKPLKEAENSAHSLWHNNSLQVWLYEELFYITRSQRFIDDC